MEERRTGELDAVEESLGQETAAQDDVVDLGGLVEEPPAGEETVVGEQREDAPEGSESGDGGPLSREETENQQRINAAFAKRLNAERRRFERDPIYQLGKTYAAQFESPEEARAQLLNQRAERLAADPKALALAVLRQEGPEAAPQREEAEQTDPRARVPAMVRELVEMGDRGELPPDFNIQAYLDAYPEFISDYQAFGMRAALKLARLAVEKERAALAGDKLARNAALPQSTRPAGAPREPGPDFQNMSAAQFRAFEERIRRATMDGKRVKF